ncbi:glycerol kinase GlpK [Flavobacterium soyangense]|uniref:Glycerol kinase n=1 Tax=Flavobacterium soyangense TaxID=2023265 RepID=A0A930UEH7_9FLAO|nr:glycerol kinase GlpK [Flavobacterium soyangense]MBF2708955.1 glycerol kinase GlpK [Flavobacterium soyangense]
MQNKLILALDQGTTSSKAIVFNHDGEIVSISQKSFEQIFPKPGWVEHDPNEIWSSQISVAAEVIAKAGISGKEIAAIGITNQRETTIVWDRETSEPIYNAIVWQDRRTAEYCDELKAQGHAEIIQKKTGLVLDAYFSGTKIKWILDNVPGAREKAEQGKLCFGTVDTWLIWKLTKGAMFLTDVSNASRTLLMNIHTLEWDNELLELFDIPRAMLPEIKESSEIFGETCTTLFATKIPISGVAGDQQAALFGQLCTEPGMVKNTYGTGCFMLMNTGEKPVYSNHNLLTTVAWKINGKTTYALEGSVFVGGAAVQWLRDGAKIIDSAEEIEVLAASVPDNGGVYFVPALTGLGAPYWDQYARGAILGITRGTTNAHIARATLEGIAYQVYDLVKAMEADFGKKGKELRVDGGAVVNNLLMQFQSDLFDFKVIRPKTLETTALGAAYLAGLAIGYWKSIDDLQEQWSVDRVFLPEMPQTEVEKLVKNWNKAVGRTVNWIKD